MSPGWPPIEWVPGKSAALWFAGNFAILFSGLYLGQLISDAIFPLTANTPALVVLLRIGILALIAVPLATVYSLVIPRPSRIGISPMGLTVNYGPRTQLFGWQDVRLHQLEAICFGGNLGLPTRVALTPHQLHRVSSFLAA
jgi:hypothetical protein